MSRIKSSGTKPEVKLREALWKNGLRGYRVKNRITGRPDIYFPTAKLAIFVDGCFWHKCPVCFIAPKSNTAFWEKKINENIARDIKVNRSLNDGGIRYLRLWEHEVNESLEGCFLKIKKLKHEL